MYLEQNYKITYKSVYKKIEKRNLPIYFLYMDQQKDSVNIWLNCYFEWILCKKLFQIDQLKF